MSYIGVEIVETFFIPYNYPNHEIEKEIVKRIETLEKKYPGFKYFRQYNESVSSPTSINTEIFNTVNVGRGMLVSIVLRRFKEDMTADEMGPYSKIIGSNLPVSQAILTKRELTKRELIAAMVLQGFLSNKHVVVEWDNETVTNEAINQADALLKKLG